MKKVHVFGYALVIGLFVFAAATSMAQQAEKAGTAQQAEKPAVKHHAAKDKASGPLLTGKLNINTASAEQIEMLPGLGASKAKAIIDYRSSNGNFKKIEDLENIKGIKEKKVAQFKDYVVFEGETTLKQVK